MRLKRIAPTFPVRDVRAALAYYERLGFATREYGDDENAIYGFAAVGDVELHVGIVPDGKPSVPATAYLYVEDADELAKEWTSAGGIVHPPQDTEWGQREGVLIDPDGNIIRFGSPLTR